MQENELENEKDQLSHLLITNNPLINASTEFKLHSEMLMSEAGRQILRRNLKKFLENETLARDANDSEGVHNMRVATRRLRATLKLLEESVFDPVITRRFRKHLRKLANALGATRDSDVLLQHLNEYISQQLPETHTQLEEFRQAIVKINQKARVAMLDTLGTKAVQRLLLELEALIETYGKGELKPRIAEHEVAPTLVRHFAGSFIWKSYEAVLAYETAMPAPLPVLHRLRVACKKFRYTLNFFEEALPEEAHTLVDKVSHIQDYLGQMQDHWVGIARAEHLLLKHPDNEAILHYRDERLAALEEKRNGFELIWKKLVGEAFRQNLAMVIAGVSKS
ncbi:MAG: CHAD domain-containing protein [Chloroflexi bacterium]|uniref:CHAD domain-containing protein n=1 Tax=Candidatus Chlorohelix allophototropha TaxID=3003348 RepID=A0A8T7M5M6_9CHLR|nr:CHAD domain-containing protein [Chloroflexota bacterium]WJW69210.1 CHAD domain-containing protein [Chloroflexota bacterium L227-S17]